MKKINLAVLTGALTIGAALLYAQESPQPNQERPQHPRGHHRPPPPPPPPVLLVLDANKDRVIDANEIANASNALLQLDINQDGQLTDEELRPPCPDGPPPEGFGYHERPPGDQ